MTTPTTPPVTYRCCEHCGGDLDLLKPEERDRHERPCANRDTEDCPGREETS